MNEQKTAIPEKPATSVYFQLICITLSSIAMGLMLLNALQHPYLFDKKPTILPILPKDVVRFGGTPTTVKVGLTINNFSVFNIITNEFSFTGSLWFEFDPTLISLDTIKNFSFEKGEIISISEPITKIIGNNLFASFDIRVKKKENLNHILFPFNTHSFNIILDSRAFPGELVFESSITDFVIAKEAVPAGWTIIDSSVQSGYSTSELSPINQQMALYHPRLIFTADLSLKSLRHLLTILFPLILLFFITSLSFSMDPTLYHRSIITLTASSTTAMLAYRFVIENLSPSVGYFMLSDMLFFLFLTACCLIFLLNTKTLELKKRAKEICTICLHLAVCSSMFLIFRWWGL